MNHHEDLQPDLQPVVAQLRANRPEATALELDAIKQRVRTRVTQPARRRTRRAQLMKSRLVILSMLVFGMLLSTAGAGLAVSGLNGNNNASIAQYGTPTPTPTAGGVLGEQNSGGGSQDVLPQTSGGGNGPGNGPSGGKGPSAATGNAVQPARQVEAGASPSSGSQLPFTGFAAIPILLGGIALLTTGLVLRRRTTGER